MVEVDARDAQIAQLEKQLKAALKRIAQLEKRLVKDALSGMLGVELSVGSVSNLEGEMSQALAPAAAEALDYVRASQAVNADETGFNTHSLSPMERFVKKATSSGWADFLVPGTVELSSLSRRVLVSRARVGITALCKQRKTSTVSTVTSTQRVK